MNITELVQSPRWKKFMGYVYGWGASVVLIGALFKIQHYPYAGELLTVGMTVEAIIFFFSAFEPPHEQPDWSLVYPELIGLEPREGSAGGGVQVEGLEQLQSFLEKMSVHPDKISNLSQGLAKLTNVAENLSNLSEAAIATNGYIESIQKASSSVGEFSNRYAESTEEISNSAQKLSNSYQETANIVSSSGEGFAKNVNDSGNKLLESYQNMDKSLQTGFDKISENSNTYNGSMSTLNNNLSSLNAIYELQLKQSDEQITNSKTVHQDLGKVLETLTVTLQNAQAYKKETEQLNENLAALNTIYGNMLSAMDVRKKN
ncbi:gliding motility protein GldL [Labilibaculum sp. A4]|uniref:type IX secretion system motor protein PorL/GldL n=1 Tax=Labilibaculum euxinus TaxID=2686357 RepID=UPI000F61F76C|nr:gliding motility protein GldL [Labilibaculum euxinus]MDQ1772409.1 gliding motility protein GldL [Labilibaculum euxinus]MWN78113.1 gliding motility protein GldL [Labilibaculum euxinus]